MNTKKHKGLFVTSILTSTGGGPKRLLMISKILQATNFDIDVFTLHKKDYSDDLSVKVYKPERGCGVLFINKFKDFFFLFNLIKKNQYDFILCNARNMYPHCKLLSILFPKVVYINLVQIVYSKTFKAFRFFYSSKILAVSEGVANYLKRKQKIPFKNITIIKNSAPPLSPTTIKQQQTLKSSLGLNNCTIIACIARYHPVKGHIYLFKAFNDLCQKHKDVGLLLMGNGDYKQALQKTTEYQKIRDRVFFLPPIGNVSNVVSIADFLVLPSLREGLPTIVLEAFSLKKTIVATDIAGTREVVTNEYNGILVAPRDHNQLMNAVERLIRDKNLRKELEYNAYKTYHNDYSFTTYKDKITKYFLSTLMKRQLQQ